MVSRSSSLRNRIKMQSGVWYRAMPGTTETLTSGCEAGAAAALEGAGREVDGAGFRTSGVAEAALAECPSAAGAELAGLRLEGAGAGCAGAACLVLAASWAGLGGLAVDTG
jgi:hypothetical protein